MTLLKHAPFQAFKSYRFPDPDTKFLHTGASFDSLISNIRFYRAQNELEEIEFLEAVVENYLCHLPIHIGCCEQRPKLKRGVIPFLRGGIMLLKNLLYNKYVDQETADRRAETCSKCILNTFPDKGPFIEWSDRLALHTIGARKSKHHDELGTCTGCGCPLRCKVWYGGTIKLSTQERETMSNANSSCWQL